MRITWDKSLACAVSGAILAFGLTAPAYAQTAADAALDFARTLDGTGAFVSNDTYLSALESDAAAGRPLALWQLGTMYENGEGVEQDYVTAYAWAGIATTNGNNIAPRFKSEFLEPKMTLDQIAKAEELVKEMVGKNPKLLNKK